MPSFKRFTHETGPNVVAVPLSTGTAGSYQSPPLQDAHSSSVDYGQLRDALKGSVGLKNERFLLNEHSRPLMSVDEQDEQRIEQEIQRRLASRLQSLREEVVLEAKQTGYVEGYQAGEREAQEQTKDVLSKALKILASFESAKKEIVEANLEIVLRSIVALARRVLQKEVSLDEGYLKRVVLQICEGLGTRENIRVLIPDSSAAAVESLQGDLDGAIKGLRNLTIERDPYLKPGDVRVETEFVEIDASLEAQIQNLLGAMSEG